MLKFWSTGLVSVLLCSIYARIAALEFEQLQVALNEIPSSSRPERGFIAQNGAIYVQLQNGLELILKQEKTAPVVTVQTWMKTGAIHEQEWIGAGLSHFCEHLLFKGTTKRPTGELDQEVRKLGGQMNAYTTSERTVYYIVCPQDGLFGAVDCMADMIRNATFPEEEVLKEHGVVVKEIERSLDDPQDALWSAFEGLMYQIHPYRVPVLGYRERFLRVTREEVYNYYRRRYVPQLCTVLVVGDFEPVSTLKLLHRHFADWQRADLQTPVVPLEPPQVAVRNIRITHPLCRVPGIMLGFPTVSLRDRDLYALDVLAEILGNGRTSRLYREVQDRQRLATEIACFSYTPLYTGQFVVTATPAGDPEQTIAAIEQVLRQAAESTPDENELLRAKRKIRTRQLFELGDVEHIAQRLGGDWLIAGDLDFSERYIEQIAAVTAEEVQRVARIYLQPHLLNVAILLPESELDPKPKEAVDATVAASAKPDLPEYVASHEQNVYAGAQTHFVRFKNGLRLIVREDRSLPVLQACLAVAGGQRWETEEQAGASWLMSKMLERGTSKKSKTELAAALDAMGAESEVFAGRNAFGFKIRTLREDFAATLELTAQMLCEPAFAEEEFEKLRNETLAEIERERESLIGANNLIFRPLLYGKHPYSRSIRGNAATVQKLTAKEMQPLHARLLSNPERIVLTACGDIGLKDALALVSERLMPKLEPFFKHPWTPGPPVALPAALAKESKTAKEPGIEGAVLTLGFRGVPANAPEEDTLTVLVNILSGLAGRLSLVIREELGIAYDVGVYHDAQPEAGALIFYVQTDAQNVERCRQVIWDKIEEICELAISEAELERVKRYLIGDEAISFQDRLNLVQRISLAELYGFGLPYVFERSQRIEKVNSHALQEAARRFLNKDDWAEAVLLPAVIEQKE